jgi:hypothetical protein
MKMKIKKLAHKRKVTKKYTCHLMRSYNKPANIVRLVPLTLVSEAF